MASWTQFSDAVDLDGNDPCSSQESRCDLPESRDRETFRIIKLFLANAVRESWEETGLSPWNISFLGPLPCYSLFLFRRTIFPLVGFAKKRWNFCPNVEVESIVEIPLMAFLDESNYALYNVETSSEVKTARQRPNGFPVSCRTRQYRQGGDTVGRYILHYHEFHEDRLQP